MESIKFVSVSNIQKIFKFENVIINLFHQYKINLEV